MSSFADECQYCGHPTGTGGFLRAFFDQFQQWTYAPSPSGSRFRRILILYGSPRGRINRKKYLLWIAVPIVAAWFMLSSTFTIRLVGPRGFFLLAWTFRVVATWPSLVGLAKRLQDFGAPGFPVAAVISVVPVIELLSQPYGLGLAGDVVRWFGILVVLFAAFTEGEPGENRYGPDPLTDPIAVAE